MVRLTIESVECSSEFIYTNADDGSQLTVTTHVRAGAPLPPDATVECNLWLTTGANKVFKGMLPVVWKQSGSNVSGPQGSATLTWCPHEPPGPYQVSCQLLVSDSAFEPGPVYVHPKLIYLIPPFAPMPLPPVTPGEAADVKRPRGDRSPLPLNVSNLIRVNAFGLPYDTTLTGYPLVEFFPRLLGETNRAVVDPDARDLYAACIGKVDAGISQGTDHAFFVVYGDVLRPGLDGYGLVAPNTRAKSESVREGGHDRTDIDEQIACFRDAIELDPNNLRAYLDIVRALAESPFGANFPLARRYYLNLFFRLVSAVRYVEPFLTLGEPERQSAARIWTKLGPWRAKDMDSVMRVRQAYMDYPTNAFIGLISSLASSLGLAPLLPMAELSAERLAWLRPPPPETISAEELGLLVPFCRDFDVSNYFKRRLPRTSGPYEGIHGFYPDNLHRAVYTSLQNQLKPVINSGTAEESRLQEWLRYVGQPPTT